MYDIIVNLLDDFAKYLGFNNEQKSFSISFGGDLSNYDIHRMFKKIIELQKYDNTGNFQLLYAQHLFNRYIEEKTINLKQFLLEEEQLKETKVMWKKFNAPAIVEIKSVFLENINSIVKKIMRDKAIGNYRDIKESKLLNIVSNSLEDLDKLKIETYSLGNEKSNNLLVSTNIILFESLKQALENLTYAPDGIYIAYIGDKSLAGFFSIFIKDNDNLVSFNERYDFVYPSQLNNMRSGRQVSEGKADNIFPYNYIFNYSDYNYKGYATNFDIDKNKLSFFKLGYNVYLPLIITMLMVKSYYLNNDMQKELVYSLSLLLEKKTQSNKALINIKDNHALAKVYDTIEPANFEIDKLLESKELAERFTSDRGYRTGESMRSNHVNQNILDFYKDEYNEEIRSKSISKAISLLNTGDFVGTPKRAELFQYWVEREGIAKFLKKKLESDMKKAGGIDNLTKYFETLVNENKDMLVKKVLTYDMEKSYIASRGFGYYSPVSNNRGNLSVRANTGRDNGYFGQRAINTADYNYHSRKDIKCPVTGSSINVWFLCEVHSYKNLVELFGEEKLKDAPDILKTWRQYVKRGGNSILDMIDPVDLVKHPINIYNRGSASPFSFIVAFSKRGYVKYCKSENIKYNKFWLNNNKDESDI